jgi:hypothetical protein
MGQDLVELTESIFVAPLTSDGAKDPSPANDTKSFEAPVAYVDNSPTNDNHQDGGLAFSDLDDGPVPNTAESFIVLSRSAAASFSVPSTKPAAAGPQASNLSYRLRVATKMFDVMNSKSDFDHPLCQDCADLLLEKLDRRLADITAEQEAFTSFLKDLEAAPQKQPRDRAAIARIEEETDVVC